ncbi:hypothetical protein [Streptomyces antibioticus]|uniref:hypothetical protein n=1 Tax=Streptomyces antibioticus TaxID=1890 RepID=UPI0036A7D6A6
MSWPLAAMAVLLVLLVVLVVLAVDDARWRRRPRPRVRQRPARVPYLPDTRSGWPWEPEFLLVRGRHVRATRARYRYEPPRAVPRPPSRRASGRRAA